MYNFVEGLFALFGFLLFVFTLLLVIRGVVWVWEYLGR